MKAYRFLLLAGYLFFVNGGFGQSSLQGVEKNLSSLAHDILMHDSLSYKIKQNRAFTKQLISILKRPESFSYPFESLKTISILSPQDKSFRLFTWHIVDKNYDEYYGKEHHYYFGLIQRKYVHPDGRTEYIVIPLLEMPRVDRGVENTMLDDRRWLGAQYYPARHYDYIPSYEMKYYGRPNLDGKQKKLKKKFYVLLGWNGADNRSNFKVIDLLSFDDTDPYKANFGADVFYFDMIPKFRAVFHYAETSPFSLNYDYVKSGPFKLFKKRMIIYDHLASPNNAGRELTSFFEMGPDGSYDALNFYKTRGYFEWYRNVESANKVSQGAKKQREINQEKILRSKLAEYKRLAQESGNEELVAEIEKLEKQPKLGKKMAKLLRRREIQVLRDQENLGKEERKKLEKIGLK